VTVLDADLLARIRSRAAGYDRDNAFFVDDLDELRAAGYLASRPLLEVARDQRLLAAHAPATALGIGMHLVVVGIARVLHERGDGSLDWILDDAAAGELFAFGNSEAGNDRVMFDSRTVAAPQPDGSYLFTGTKIFTSLSPAWTRLVVFGRDDTDAASPTLVHGAITRDTPGHHTVGDWNPLGMRATQSLTTVLDGARVDPGRITRMLPVGPVADPYIFGLFADFLLLISSVYAGIADRALELAVENVASRRSLATGATYSEDPDIRWQLADAAMASTPSRRRSSRSPATSTRSWTTGPRGSACSSAPRRGAWMSRGPWSRRPSGSRAARRTPQTPNCRGSTATRWPVCSTRATPSRRTRPSRRTCWAR